MPADRNLFINPALANNATGWTSVSGNYARSTSVTGLPRTTGWQGTVVDDSNSPRAQVTAGQQYVYSVSIRAVAAQSFNMLVNFYAAPSAGAFIANSGPTTQVILSAGQVQRYILGPFTVPAGAVSSHIKFNDIDAGGVEITAIRCTPYSGDLIVDGEYFDGSSPGASWDGVVGDSTSSRISFRETITAQDVFSRVATPIGPVATDTARASDSFGVLSGGIIDDRSFATDGFLIAQLGYDNSRGRVQISAFTFAPTVTKVLVQRRTIGGRYEDVRGGSVLVLGGSMVRPVDDYEYPAGVDVQYRLRGLNEQDQVVQQAVVSRAAADDVSWLKFVANPQLNRKIDLVGWSAIKRESRAEVFAVVGRSDPVVVTDVHGSRETTVQLVTHSVTDTKVLDDALSQGHPIFLQVPASLQLPTMYASVGSYSFAPLTQRSPRSRWTIPLIEVSAPPMTLVGNTSTYATVLAEYTSYADILDRVDRYRDLVA